MIDSDNLINFSTLLTTLITEVETIEEKEKKKNLKKITKEMQKEIEKFIEDTQDENEQEQEENNLQLYLDELKKSLDDTTSIIESCKTLHQKGGEGYDLAETLLEQYLSMKYDTLNIKSILTKEQLNETEVPDDKSFSKAEVSDLLDEIEATQKYNVVLCHYSASSQLNLENIAVNLIESAISSLSVKKEAHIDEVFLVLNTKYLNIETRNLTSSQLLEKTGLKRMTFYKRLERGISLVSQFIFGFSGEDLLTSPFHQNTSKWVSDISRLREPTKKNNQSKKNLSKNEELDATLDDSSEDLVICELQ